MSLTLITGAAGFIGSQLAYRLWKNHEDIVLIDDFSYGSSDNLHFEDKCFDNDLINVDITNFSELDKLFDNYKPDYVFHIAGIAPLPDCQTNPFRACEVNIGGTVNILECSRKYGVKNVIFASTSAIYENDVVFPSLENHVTPPSLIYPSTKFCAEQFCKSYYDCYGLNISIMRFANVYGPHIDCLRKQPPFVAYVIRELFFGNSPILHSDGQQSRDYIFIDDLLDLACKLKDNTGFDIINVSSNTSYSVKQIYKIIADIMETDIQPTFTVSKNYWRKYPQLYEGMYPIKEQILDNEVNKYTLCDNNHANVKYQWSPKISLEVGLRKTVDYTVKLLKTKQ